MERGILSKRSWGSFSTASLCFALGGVLLNGVLSLSAAPQVEKATRVRITQGHVQPDSIAFVHLVGDTTLSKDLAGQFLEIVRRDLCNCGMFTATSPAAFLQKPETLAVSEPRLEDWRAIKTRFLICGSAQEKGGNVQITLRLYDVNRNARLLVLSIVTSRESLRNAAHRTADQIYTRLTGEKGMFNTQLAYIEALPPQIKKGVSVSYLRRLRIMDQDGANDRALTEGDSLVMTPRFSPDCKTIVYLAYRYEGSGRHRRPTAQVYLLDLATRRSRPLLTAAHLDAISRANGGAKVTMTYAPRFSPDGRSICFSLIINGRSAIYTMNITEGRIRRLTDHRAIDTSPAYSPDGKSIVFTSNRSGKEKIYIMDTDGGHVRRVTNGEGKFSQPVFSPRGDFIAFSKQVGNQFYIGVVRPNGTEERLIIQGYLAESPSWSPNGRYILFIWQDHPRHPQSICKVDLTGFFMQKMVTQKEARDCSWSPLQ